MTHSIYKRLAVHGVTSKSAWGSDTYCCMVVNIFITLSLEARRPCRKSRHLSAGKLLNVAPDILNLVAQLPFHGILVEVRVVIRHFAGRRDRLVEPRCCQVGRLILIFLPRRRRDSGRWTQDTGRGRGTNRGVVQTHGAPETPNQEGAIRYMNRNRQMSGV